MSDGFSAFKAMAFGIGGLLIATSVVPQVANGQFDPLRLTLSKGKGKGKTSTSDSGGTTTSPTPTPTPTPTTNTTYPELSMIPSDFDINSELISVPLQQPVTNDVVGAFRFVCNAGQILYDDPIVFPGQPGKSHLHQFFGNTAANAYSSYDSLRTSGDSTCMNKLNRSAYWMPAMLDGRGNVVRPDYITIYYKRCPKTSPYCGGASNSVGTACLPLPNGLRYIFGYNMNAPGTEDPNSHYFTCDGAYRSNNIVDTAKNCPNGKHLGAAIVAPICWNGTSLDSADHRSHMAYPSYGSWGYLKCPSTHPYVLADFSLVAWYTVDDTLDKSGTWEAGKTVTWSLSSDNMPGKTPSRPGSTLHGDWWGAWDNTIMAMWHDNCIDRMLSCNSGDLGNGKALKIYSGFSWTANPKTVPLPL